MHMPVGGRRRNTILAAACAWALALAPAAAAAKPKGEPAPFGHACTAQDGVRFCPTAGLEDRVPSFDGVPLDVDVTLPPSGSGPFPTIVMMHGWGGSKTAFESTTPGRGRKRDVRLQQRLLRPARLRRRQLLRPWLGPLVRELGIPHRTGLQRRLDQARRPALRGARHPVPARPARRRTDRQAEVDRRDRHLLRRGAVDRARLPEEPHPARERRIPAVDEPGREGDGNQGRLPALAVVRPRRRARAQRPLPRHADRLAHPEPGTDRRRDPELRDGPLRGRRRGRLYRAAGRRRRSRPHQVVRVDQRGRAVPARSRSDREPDLRIPRRLLHPPRPASPHRCSSRAAGPTTCSRPSSRCASTTRFARPRATRP